MERPRLGWAWFCGVRRRLDYGFGASFNELRFYAAVTVELRSS